MKKRKWVIPNKVVFQKMTGKKEEHTFVDLFGHLFKQIKVSRDGKTVEVVPPDDYFIVHELTAKPQYSRIYGDFWEYPIGTIRGKQIYTQEILASDLDIMPSDIEELNTVPAHMVETIEGKKYAKSAWTDVQTAGIKVKRVEGDRIAVSSNLLRIWVTHGNKYAVVCLDEPRFGKHLLTVEEMKGREYITRFYSKSETGRYRVE